MMGFASLYPSYWAGFHKQKAPRKERLSHFSGDDAGGANAARDHCE
jgi:hypothetical protein